MDSKATLRSRLVNLPPEQRAVLLQQIADLRKRRDNHLPVEQHYPLSLAQRRLWMLSQLSNEASAAYNIAAVYCFDKRLDPERLQNAWRKLIANHEVLRSAFTQEGDELFQIPRIAAGWNMRRRELVEDQNHESQLLQLATEEAATVFDLQQDWLINVTYCDTDTGKAGIVIVIHHIVCDGLSITSMVRELAQYYDEVLESAEVPASFSLQYRDYVEYEARADNSNARNYWKDIFASPPETLDALLDLPRPVVKDFSGNSVALTVAPVDAVAFETFCHAHNATLYMGLVAIVQLLLARFANVDEVTLGTPVAGRPNSQFDKVVGPFVNTVALRQNIDCMQSFPELLTQVRRRVLDGFQHQGLAFDELVTALGFMKDPSRSPLYDVMLGLTSAKDVALNLGDSEGRPLRIPMAFSKVDLTFHFEKESNGSLRLDLEFADSLLLDETALRLCKAWKLVLLTLPNQPSLPIGELELQSQEESRLLIESVNSTLKPYPQKSSLIDEFSKIVCSTPDAIAVHAGDTQLSYRALDDLSEQLAISIQKQTEFQPSCRIAFMLEKDERALIIILAILKSRAVYVPLAANTPLERVCQIIDTGEVRLLFAEANRMEELQHLGVALINSNTLFAEKPKSSIDAPFLRPAQSDEANLEPAYLIFTSGSTGIPKGTLIEQRSVLRLVCNTDYHQVMANERVLLTGSLSFDAATFEIWGPLLNGGCVCIPTGTTLLEVHEFGTLVEHYEVDTAFLTTGLFNQLVDNSAAAFSRLQTVLTGGEKISVDHVRKLLLAHPTLKLLHVYGPTENTTFSTWHRITADDLDLVTIPIGRPIANSQIYLLDQNLRPVPIGVPGEIYCGGDGVARGYIEQRNECQGGQPAVFLLDPFVPAATSPLYRTGDLAKWNHKRELVFLGRNDRQVKIRGFRVELGEVEHHLRTLPGFTDAFVQARGDAGSSELVAWLVGPIGLSTTVGAVRDALKGSVPNYMLPAKIVCLQRLPLNASGKVDVRALPLPEDTNADCTTVGQLHNKAEQDLARLYSVVLGITGNAASAIDREANFFSLGGDSIRAIQLVSLARSEGYQFSLKEIFASETLAGLAATANVLPAMVTEETLSAGPLSPTQQWWLDQSGMPVNHFNLSSVFKVAAPIEITVLHAALEELVTLHPALRLQLDLGEKQQKIKDKGRFVLHKVEAGQSRQNCWRELQQAIDLQKGILLAVGVAEEENVNWLAIVVHHIAADEVSGRLFIENLQRLYHQHLARLSGQNINAMQKPVREALGIINWAAQLKAIVEQGSMDDDLSYWQDITSQGRQILDLQQDLFVEDKELRSSTVQTIDQSESQTLLHLGSSLLRLTPQEIVLASFIRAWQRSLELPDCLLSLEGHGREQIENLGDSSSTLGWFTSLFPFVHRDSSTQDFDIYREVKDRFRRIPCKGFTYLPLRYYKDLETQNTLALRPLLSFNFLGDTLEDENAWLSAVKEQAAEDHGESVNEPFKLDVLARITQGQFELTLRGQNPRATITLTMLAEAWREELGILATYLQNLASCKGDDRCLLSLSDSLVPFPSLAELDATLAELTLPSSSIEEILPLTGMQSGMWLHCATHPTAYQDQVALRLKQPLDETLFAQAVDVLVAETQALRTGFAKTPRGELLQIVFRDRSDYFQFIDASAWGAELEVELTTLRATLRARHRDLLRDPLFSLTLVRVNTALFELIIDFHHIVLDGWTSSLLLKRLEALYFTNASGGDRNSARGMRTYFEWLRRQPVGQARDYWQRLLGDYQSRSDVPTHLPRIPATEPVPLFVESRTGASLYAKLVSWCAQRGLTVNAAIQSLWGVYLGRVTGSDDLVFGATVSGRDSDVPDIGNIAGMLINTLPIRIRAGDSKSFADLVRENAQQFAESMTFGHLTLAEIQTLTTTRTGLVTHALVFENYPEADITTARWDWQAQAIFDPMHFEFGLIVAPLDGDLSFRFVADGSLYLQNRLEKMGEELCELLSTLLNSHQSLVEISNAEARGWTVSANFTADSLVGLLQYHEYISGRSGAVTLLPYNQSVQELLNPASRLRRMHAQQHVVLWRPLMEANSCVMRAASFEQLAELAAALAAYAHTFKDRRLFFVPCPWWDCDWSLYQEFIVFMEGALVGLQNSEVLDLASLDRRYSLHLPCLPNDLIFGDIPYNEEFFAAIANQLVRLRDLQSRQPVKVYVVDADDTLWGGIVGEEGAQGIRLDTVHISLQEQLISARAAGALICVATKNNIEDVRAVFDQREMPLRWNHLTRVCAGWGPKSESIQTLAKELSLGMDSFVFIDDSPLECEQLLTSCPGVLIIQLPPEEQREAFLAHHWLLDARASTQEDVLRSEMYAKELQRVDARKTSNNYAEFLASLNIEVVTSGMQHSDLPRVAQLSQRTNQFNTTGNRYTEGELDKLMQEPGIEIRCVRVSDKYGDYGLAGSVFIKKDPESWTVFGILLSCRVLGRGVEHLILRQLAQEATENGINTLLVNLVKLARNAPALQFLQGITSALDNGQSKMPLDATVWQFLLPVSEACNWQPVMEASDTGQHGDARNESDATVENTQSLVAQNTRQVALITSRYYSHLASTLNTGDAITQALQHQDIISKTANSRINTPTRTQPATQTELILASLFTELLGHTEIFREDSFHELGGHSLKAMMLFSRISARFGITLDFQDLQAHPTLAELAARIELSASATEACHITEPVLRVLSTADDYAISPGQSRLWMLENIRAVGPSPLHMHATLTVQGRIDKDALDSALAVLFERHESLRTCFIKNAQNQIRQVIVPTTMLNIGATWFNDLIDDAELSALAQEQSSQPFDLSKAPLVRIAAGDLAQDQSVLFITMHHIICDGWSIGIFAKELTEFYKDFTEKRCPNENSNLYRTERIQFRDFSSWQLEWLRSEAGVRATGFWRDHFEHSVEVLQLPAAAPRPALMQSTGASVQIDIDVSIWSEFKCHVSSLGISDFAGLFAAVQLVLARISGQKNFCVGTAVAGRQHQQLESVIGFFVNLLPLKSTLVMESSVDVFLHTVAAEVSACLSHQGVPFDTIVSNLDLPRDPSRSPLFDVLLVLQNTEEEDLKFGAHVAEIRPFASTTSQYDLTLNAFPTREGSLKLIAEFDSTIYSASNIELILRCISRTLQGLTDQRSESLDTTPWLEESDIACVLAFEGKSIKSKQELLPNLFKRVTNKTDARISDNNNNWSYAELECEMQRVSCLLRVNLIHSGKANKLQAHVGIIGNRSVRSIAAMLGVMEAGAVYIPLDLDNSVDRLQLIIEVGEVDLLLSTDEEGAGVASDLQRRHPKLRHIPYPNVEDVAGRYGDDIVHITPSDVAYMIFTSGSTGKPKGVQITHASFAAMILQQVQAFDVKPSDVCGQFAALTFDASLSEVFLALATGASLSIAPNEVRGDTDAFTRWLNDNAVTVMTLPPVFLRTLKKRSLGKLRVLVTAGEAAVDEDMRHYAASMRVLNAYGPTETSVCASIYLVNLHDEWPFGVPIGSPLPGVQLTVRDSYGARVPIGCSGELYIGGATLAKGYYSAPELSAEKFKSIDGDPKQCLWYRSGDLVRWREDGLLEFLGRVDSQIKIRGYRIEPGELEHTARNVAGIRDAVALAHPQLGLLLYCLTNSTAESKDNSLRSSVLAELRKMLPNYMIPSDVLLLDEFPLSTAGKIARTALLTLASKREFTFAPPETEAQCILAQAWQHVLKVERVGQNDDFFTLGGDSIKALEVINTLRELNYSCELKDFFSSPFLAEIASSLKPYHSNVEYSEIIIGKIPLLPVQNWFLRSRKKDAAAHFHIVTELEVPAHLSEKMLKEALTILIRNHDALRACFYQQQGNWIQEIQESIDLKLAVRCYQRIETIETHEDRTAIEELACRPFELEKAPLFRCVLVQKPNGESESLVLTLHHLIADWVSLRILVANLNALVLALSKDAFFPHSFLPQPSPPHLLKLLAQERAEELTSSLPSSTHKLIDSEYRKAVVTMNSLAMNCGVHSELNTLHLQIAAEDLTKLRSSLRRRSAAQKYEFRLQDLLMATALGELGDMIPSDEVPLLIETHGRDSTLNLAGQVAWLTRARLFNLKLKIFNGTDGLLQAYRVLKADESLQPDAFACEAAEPTSRGSLPALISFNYLGEFANNQSSEDLLRLTNRVFNKSVSPNSPVDLPLHMEFYVVDSVLEIQLAWSPEVFESEAMRTCWETIRQKLTCF